MSGSTNFPGSLDSHTGASPLGFGEVNNQAHTKTTTSHTDSVTTLTVADTTDFPTKGYVVVKRELISYTGKTSTTLTGCTRAVGGTTADAYLSGTVVEHVIVAANHNDLAAAGAANAALNAAKATLGIESPSKVFRDQVGKQIGAGAVLGINASAPAFMLAVQGMVQPAVEAAGLAVSTMGMQALAMAEAVAQQAQAASKAKSLKDISVAMGDLSATIGRPFALPDAIFKPSKPISDLAVPIFRPTTPVSDRAQPIFQPQPVVNHITVQGSLIHESELDRMIGGGLFSSLRYGTSGR